MWPAGPSNRSASHPDRLTIHRRNAQRPSNPRIETLELMRNAAGPGSPWGPTRLQCLPSPRDWTLNSDRPKEAYQSSGGVVH